MKRLLVLIICILSITLAGCIKDYPLSEAQTDIVAEYMANRLLHYDKHYSSSLLSYQEIYEIEPEPTDIPDINDENNDIDDSVNDENNDIDESNNDENSDNDGTVSEDIQYTLSEVIGDDSFDIQYSGYHLADTYPEDESNLVFSVDPRKGYQLLVVDFIVENISDEDRIIDLSKAQIQYQLDINVGTIYKPQLALLENNLQYIKLNVRAGEKIPAILIFEVTRDIDMSDINLIVTRDTKTKIIEIE